MNTISIKMGNLDSEYILEEKENGLTVKTPFLDEDGDGNEIISHNIIEIPKGQKADVVRQFFAQNNVTIICSGKAYNIDEIIFDEVTLPDQPLPQEITD
jgi:hypothetical protein